MHSSICSSPPLVLALICASTAGLTGCNEVAQQGQWDTKGPSDTAGPSGEQQETSSVELGPRPDGAAGREGVVSDPGGTIRGRGDPGAQDAGPPTVDSAVSDLGATADLGTDDTNPAPTTPADPGASGGLTFVKTSSEVQNAGKSIPLELYLPEGSGPFPVLVFTHGFQLGPDQYASYGEHLASWGYVVVMPALPGGLLGPVGAPSHREQKEHTVALLDWIEANASAAGGALDGKADATRIGLAGHSMGGKISLLVATEDERPKAVFGVDPVDAAGGPMPGSPADYPSVTPELMDKLAIPLGLLGETTNATCSGFMCQACAPEDDNFHQYYVHATGPAVEIEILGANHMSFLDNPSCGFVCSVCPRGNDDPAQSRLLARRYLTAFFEVFLKEEAVLLSHLNGADMQADVDAGLVKAASKNGFGL